MTEPVRLCKDCRWAENRDPEGLSKVEWWRCHHASSLMPSPKNLVTGIPYDPLYLSCSTARGLTVNSTCCGPEGRFWEPKDDDPEFSGVIGFGEALTSDDL